jgi:hypothetical protein
MTDDDEYGALLRRAYEFFCRVAAGSVKSADHVLHHENIMKNRSDGTSDFKN